MFEQLAKDLEAFQTPQWSIDAILDVELMTRKVWERCHRGAEITRALYK